MFIFISSYNVMSSDEEYDGQFYSESSDSQDEPLAGKSGWAGSREDFRVSLSKLLTPIMKQDMVNKYLDIVDAKMKEWKIINGFSSIHANVPEMENLVLSKIKLVIEGWHKVANGKVVDIDVNDPRLGEFILTIDNTLLSGGRKTKKIRKTKKRVRSGKRVRNSKRVRTSKSKRGIKSKRTRS